MKNSAVFWYMLLGVVAVVGVTVATRSELPVAVVAAASFGAVVAAALLIAWAAEASEFIVSQGLAVAIVSILQVLPEFFVEGVLAWHAAIEPEVYLHLVTANFTGANRILIGVGWPLIYLTAALSSLGKGGGFLREIRMKKEHSIEVVVLLASTLYFTVILAKRSLDIIDSAVLGGMFAWYMWALSRLPSEEEDPEEILHSAPFAILKLKRARRRNIAILSLFATGGAVLLLVAEPFLQSLREIALVLLGAAGVFIFIQWVAPFLSEFPEKVSAFYWARTVKLAPMALLNMISSKVNQWTMLVAMIPLVYIAGRGVLAPIPLDLLQLEEIFLTFTQSIYGVACLAKLRLTRANITVLLSLWSIQFVLPETFMPGVRLLVALAYIPLTVYELWSHRGELVLFKEFKMTAKTHRLWPIYR